MSDPVKIEWGDYEPPKPRRKTPGVPELVEQLKANRGRWAQVSIDGVTNGRLLAALKVAGCDVVTRDGGEQVWACWPPDVRGNLADAPEVEA